MRRYILAGLGSLILLVAIVTVAFVSSDRSKQARLALLSKYENEAKYEIAQGILWELVRDYPTDPIILDHLNRNDIAIEHAREELRNRWQMVSEQFDDVGNRLQKAEQTERQIQGRVGTLHNRVGSFQTQVEDFQGLERQQWVSVSTERERTAASDYLYLLLNEKKSESNQLSPQEIDQHIGLALGAAINHDYTKVKSESARVLRAEPINQNAAAMWAYATVIMAPETAENQRRILPVVENIIRIVSNNAWALQTAGMIYQVKGNTSIAEDRYRKAYEIQPDGVDIQKNYVQILIKNNKFQEGLPIATKLWKQTPSDEMALLVWQCLASESETQKTDFLTAWKTRSETAALPDEYLGELAYAKGAKAQAIQYYESANRKRTGKALQQRLAEIYLELGQDQAAIKYLHTIVNTVNVKIESGRAEFIRYGSMLISAEQTLKQYADIQVDAPVYLSVDPTNTGVRQILGHAYESLGDIARAIGSYEAIYQTSEQAGIVLPLLELYLKTNNFNAIKQKGSEMMAKSSDPELQAQLKDLLARAEIKAKQVKK